MRCFSLHFEREPRSKLIKSKVHQSIITKEISRTVSRVRGDPGHELASLQTSAWQVILVTNSSQYRSAVEAFANICVVSSQQSVPSL